MGEAVRAQVKEQRPWSRTLGAQLQAARVRASLSRSEIAARLGVSSESVRRWEQGGSKPSDLAVRAFMSAAGADGLRFENRPDSSGQNEASLEEIAKLIRQRRTERRLSQVQAAAAIGVAQPTLAGWEIGRSRPGRDLAAAIAAFLGLPLPEVEQLLHQPLSFEMERWPTFGRIIGERRLSLQIDRNELATRLHVSPRTVAAWETGEKVPNNSHLAKLADVLGVAPVVLVSALPERLPPTELGRLIYRRQRLLGLDRDAIAAACDVAPVTVGRWIWGRNAPTFANVEQLAKVLELDPRILRSAVSLDAAATAIAPAAGPST